ncbi:hypothetical protein AO498_07855 [Algoriphagus sanaruensis]|uniref:Uncharacterized protein n=1 Tax=Algoriphagus sanaruensis TaxID=1727163 RepID=A0A142EMH2_9BACT|nr:hypothetical protein AO498_07855 [Algoriphagus sanaruensis]
MQTELSLNPALCQSLYGFNPLTINPDLGAIFKKAPFFLLFLKLIFVKSLKTGLKIRSFSVEKCKKWKNRFFIS